MSVGPTGDGSTVQADGTCTYPLSGTAPGMYRMTGEFDGLHMNLSGNPLGLDIALQGLVVGDSVSGTYNGSSTSPCFVYTGTFQGTKR